METDKYYHIYNRANGSDNLFREPENYNYFLLQWQKYIPPVADTLAFCLMPNHFHFLIKIKGQMELERFFKDKLINRKNKLSKGSNKNKLSKGLEPLESYNYNYLKKQISLRFSHLFNAYAQAYNKMYRRRGSLFSPNFKKKAIDTDEYLTAVIFYIHNNPVHHGFTNTITAWPYCSYHSIINDTSSIIDIRLLTDWFGGMKALIEFHENQAIDLSQFEIMLT